MTKIWTMGSGECDQLGKSRGNLSGQGKGVQESQGPGLVELPIRMKFVKLVCGGLHTLALTHDGDVFSWGCNDDGALGRSGAEHLPLPVRCGMKVRVSNISAGDSHSIAYNSELGIAYMWGVYRHPEHGNIMKPILHPRQIGKTQFRRKPIQKVVSGTHHTLFLVEGRVYVSGDSENINLGTFWKFRPGGGVEALPFDDGKLRNTDVFAGGNHSFMVRQSGELLGWGANFAGQLGVGHCQNAMVPEPVLKLDGNTIRCIVAGNSHTIILLDNGDVYSCGSNDEGQLGYDHTKLPEYAETAQNTELREHCWPIPSQVPGLRAIAQVIAGSNFTYCLDGRHTLYSWYGAQFEL
jgi:regulator of chromosome condensation